MNTHLFLQAGSCMDVSIVNPFTLAIQKVDIVVEVPISLEEDLHDTPPHVLCISSLLDSNCFRALGFHAPFFRVALRGTVLDEAPQSLAEA